MRPKIHLSNPLGVHAEASTFRQQLEEQNDQSVKIEIKEWIREAARLTVLDYLSESYPEYAQGGEGEDGAFNAIMSQMGITGAKPQVAAVGREGTVKGTSQGRIASSRPDPERVCLTSWTKYLAEIVGRRKAGRTLVQIEDNDYIGFIDDSANEEILIEVTNIRESRRAARASASAMAELDLLAFELGLEGAEGALASSKTPATRASLLGWAPYGLVQPADKKGEEHFYVTGDSFELGLGEETEEDATGAVLGDMWFDGKSLKPRIAPEIAGLIGHDRPVPKAGNGERPNTSGKTARPKPRPKPRL